VLVGDSQGIRFARLSSPQNSTVVKALAWTALAAWSGVRGWRSFLPLAVVFWGLAIIDCLLAMWAASSDAIVPGHEAILILVIFIGPALHGLGPFVPIESQQVRYLATAIAIVTLTLAGYLIGRKTARPSAP